MPTFVLPLDSPAATLERAGGKGANLSKLLRAQFPVPPGFVVTTNAYDAFLDAGSLRPFMVGALTRAPGEQAVGYEDASPRIRQAFDSTAIPSDIAEEISAAYRALGGPAVAVRSSATAEDLPGASFAGQQETYLNVCRESAVLAAVRRCWSSLWTARALAYRAQHEIPHDTVGLAVVVQQMVPADSAGVLFTVDPLTGNADQIVINAAWGLGEAVVGGRVSPDTLVVDKQSGRLLRVEPGAKTIMTMATPAGTAEMEVDPAQRKRPVLSEQQAAELGRLGREIEALFGKPQDIEWAVAAGAIAILQARPVTVVGGTLAPRQPLRVAPPPPPGEDDWPALDEFPPQPFDLFTRTNVGENWPEPVTPLTWSFLPAWLRQLFLGSLPSPLKVPYVEKIQWTRRFDGRVYFNEGAILQVWGQEYGMPRSALESLSSSGIGMQVAAGNSPTLKFLSHAPALMHSALVADVGRELAAHYARVDTWVRDAAATDLQDLSDSELQVWLADWHLRWTQGMVLFGRALNQANSALLFLGGFLAANGLERDCPTHHMVTGLSGVFTAEMAPALWSMGKELRARLLDRLVLDEPPEEALAKLRRMPEGAGFMEQFAAFLERHGHRCAGEYEWRNPRWAETPPAVIRLLAGYLNADREAGTDPAGRREQTTRDAKRRLDPLRRALFCRLLTRAQASTRYRDNTRYYNTKLLLPIRRGYCELGRRWSERGWIVEADDIFFLATEDIVRVIAAGNPLATRLDLISLVAARRQAYQYWHSVPEREAIDWQGHAVRLVEGQAGPLLTGTPASAGQARGPARLVSGPAEATRLRTGDILITHATDPGWTPVFPLIAGLVLETGGQLSHGAIVAREYAIPAVVNVKGAMQRIREGQLVRVDGSGGQVELE